ncbi:hypothetical protein Cgig2_032407 [Carnegiea gigantea]|uniref:Uncharacterized protein n=1 Tax=Carnegiea gigantea TaxID=171969 RepID=A0A9Q1KYB4_9CARY|nr:hypothetical protein Cgig2_032407 [Carnegiea gigantea]
MICGWSDSKKHRSALSVVGAMVLRIAKLPSKSAKVAATDGRFRHEANHCCSYGVSFPARLACRQRLFIVAAQDHKSSGGSSDVKKAAVPNYNYVVPLDKTASCITRPLAEILRDLNKRIIDDIPGSALLNLFPTLAPCFTLVCTGYYFCIHLIFSIRYHADQALSFYAPGAASFSLSITSISFQCQA